MGSHNPIQSAPTGREHVTPQEAAFKGEQLASSIDALEPILAALDAAAARGWTVSDHLLRVEVSIPSAVTAGMPGREILDAALSVTDVHLRFRSGPLGFEITNPGRSALQLAAPPDGDPGAVFADTELELAERAWAGDSEAALKLRGEWSGDLAVDLAAPFRDADPSATWRVVRSLEPVVEAFKTNPWWTTGELLRWDTGPIIIVVAAPDSGIVYRTPVFSVLAIDRIDAEPRPEGAIARRTRVDALTAAGVPDDLPLPEALLPSNLAANADALEAILVPRAEACAWAWLSTGIGAADSARGTEVSFFGYRRRNFLLPPDGYVAETGRATQLYRWATADDSPDRVLAVRQVVSLQDEDTLPPRPADIIDAAEPLYRALRSHEVAAVLDTHRQVRAIAFESAEQAAGAAGAAAKSAAERTIASLAAVAGIAAANATAVINDADARGIALGIAGLFIFLILWSVAVEGRAMAAPIDAFGTDLPTIGYLLSQREREAIHELEALKLARRIVLRVRVAAPLVYLAGAGISILVSHARFGLTF